MKRLLFTGVLTFLIYSFSLAQTVNEPEASYSVGFYFHSLGESEVFRFNELLGAANIKGKNYYTIGLDINKQITDYLDLGSGIEYSRHNLYIYPNIGPLIDAFPIETELSLINIPLGLRFSFMKFFYFDSDLILTANTYQARSVDNLSGIGANLGFGLEYDFESGISIAAGLYSRGYSLISFTGDDNHQRLLVSGLRIGILYRIN